MSTRCTLSSSSAMCVWLKIPKQKQPPDLSAPCALLSRPPNRSYFHCSCGHRRSSFPMREYTMLFATARLRSRASSSDAPCTPPRSATGCSGCTSAALEPSRRTFSIGLTEHRHRQSSAVRPSSDRHSRRQDNVRSVGPGLHRSSSAEGGSPCSEWRPSVAGALHVSCQQVAHRWAPRSLRSLVCARCAASAVLAAGSPR